MVKWGGGGGHLFYHDVTRLILAPTHTLLQFQEGLLVELPQVHKLVERGSQHR